MLTKPSDKIYITFSSKGQTEKGHYLLICCKSIRQMFPDIPIDTSKELNSQFKYI